MPDRPNEFLHDVFVVQVVVVGVNDDWMVSLSQVDLDQHGGLLAKRQPVEICFLKLHNRMDRQVGSIEGGVQVFQRCRFPELVRQVRR